MANDLAALKANISFLYVLRAQMCSEPLNSSKTSTKRLLPLFYMLWIIGQQHHTNAAYFEDQHYEKEVNVVATTRPEPRYPPS